VRGILQRASLQCLQANGWRLSVEPTVREPARSTMPLAPPVTIAPCRPGLDLRRLWGRAGRSLADSCIASALRVHQHLDVRPRGIKERLKASGHDLIERDLARDHLLDRKPATCEL